MKHAKITNESMANSFFLNNIWTWKDKSLYKSWNCFLRVQNNLLVIDLQEN